MNDLTTSNVARRNSEPLHTCLLYNLWLVDCVKRSQKMISSAAIAAITAVATAVTFYHSLKKMNARVMK